MEEEFDGVTFKKNQFNGEVFKVLRKASRNSGGQERVKTEYVEVTNPDYPQQIAVEFFTMAEMLEKFPKSYFDKHGNLCLCNKYGFNKNHLSPAHFSDLGEIRHINKGCGFDMDGETEFGFIKNRFKELQ